MGNNTTEEFKPNYKSIEDIKPDDTVKYCQYLDANEMGGGIFISKSALACYPRPIELLTVNDYSNIDVDTYMQERKQFLVDINNGTRNDCDGCPCLQTKKMKDINIDKIAWLNIANYETCNLRCKYCYFSEEQLGKKLNQNDTKLLPIVKQFADKNLLTDNICLAIAGGEPTLFEDIPETLSYLNKHYKFPRFNLQSNSSLSNKIENIINDIKEFPNNWKNLYTSIDAGTRETYKNIRGRDLFYNVIHNLSLYAKNNVFTEMGLKYVLVNNKEKNMYNLGMEDIFGFCNLLTQIVALNKNRTVLYIDRDLNESQEGMTEEMLRAGGILTFAAKLLGIDYIHSSCNFISKQDSDWMEKFAQNYIHTEKSIEEKYLLNLFLSNIKIIESAKDSTSSKPSLSSIQKIFSIRNDGTHKVIRLLGIKIKLRKTAETRTAVERERERERERVILLDNYRQSKVA